jgi:hypothetical protein
MRPRRQGLALLRGPSASPLDGPRAHESLRMTTYDKKRVAGGFLLAFLVLAAANWHFEFAFPRFARFIVALGALLGWVYYVKFSPTRKDFEEHTRHHTGGGNCWASEPGDGSV